MRFGPVATRDAEGAILAHSVSAGDLRLRKGRTLSRADLAALAEAGVPQVWVARPGPEDVGEDAAAAAVARTLVPDTAALGLSVSEPFTGRVNLFAVAPGLVRVDAAAVHALNAVDPGLTLATLPDLARVQARQMVATVKIIPYAVGTADLERGLAGLRPGAIMARPFRPMSASLILTRTAGMKQSLIAKGAATVEARLRGMELAMLTPQVVDHEVDAVADAIRAAAGGMVLILGASATSDVADICPAGLIASGGSLERFGMPVDPGNLLFLGAHRGRPVIGLPGCARSPALNGADWVLERLAAGIDVTGADIAAMGVGGLLKENPARPQPRTATGPAPHGRPKVAALVLAAGASSRMRGRDKLLEPVDGEPVLRRIVRAALGGGADRTVVVLPQGADARRGALDGLDAEIVVAADCAEGMAASLRAGLAAVSEEADAVMVVLADMPEIGTDVMGKLIAAFDAGEGREICRAVAADGTPGHPVLFGRRFFEALAGLTGDHGAREVVRAAGEFVVDVPTKGKAAITDLDTPEAWAVWRAR